MLSIIEFLQAQPFAFALGLFVLGLVLGSFLNVVIYRLPVMLEREWRAQCAELTGAPAQAASDTFNLVIPRSRCPHCGHRISALENIPVLSFIFLRGKCSECGAAIGWRYPFVELLTGLASALVAWQFGWGLATLGALILTWTLIALTFIDFDQQLLPDSITLPLLWLGLLFNIGGTYTDLTSAVIGAVAGYLSLWAVYQIFKLATGKEGMGYGDFKLLAALGAWLGWQVLPMIILLSSVVGAVLGIALIVFGRQQRGVPMPFGPFLAIAGWIALLWGERLTDWWFRYLGMT